jgi:dienelactone hydrolase
LTAGRIAILTADILVGTALVVLVLISDLSTAGRVAGAALAVLLTAALVYATSRDGAGVRGAAMLVGGVLGVSVGAGIASVWFSITGLSMVVVAMAAGLIAGLVLLAAGTVTLLRATPGWWRLLGIPIAFLVVQFVLVPLTGAIYGTHPPQTPTSAALPAGAESVSFQTPDGVTLVAWHTPSRNGVSVILLPGSGGEKGSTVAHAEALAKHGYGVLALDSRGTGDSGGVGNAWGWHGDNDIAGAIGWLEDAARVQPGRIAVLGLSMGGEEAITAAATDERIGAVVAEGVSARVPADLDYLPRDLTGIIQLIDAWVMWGAADLMTDAAAPVPLTEAVAQVSAPVLLTVGNDQSEVLAAPRLEAAAPALDTWVLPDTPHMQSLALHPQEWEHRVIGFLDAAIGRVTPD